VEPIDYVRALIRRWPIIAISAFMGAFFAFVMTPTGSSASADVQSQYRATHTMLSTLQTVSSTSSVGTVTFAQVPVFATTGEVPRLAAEKLGWSGPPAALAAQVIVETDPTTGTIRFTSTQEQPDDAVRIADTFADETVAYLSARQEEIRQGNLADSLEDVERLEDEIDQLDRQLARNLGPDGTGRGSEVLRARRDAAVREYSIAYETYRSLANAEEGTLNLTTLERAQPVAMDTGGGFTPPQSRSTRVPLAALVGALLGAGVALLVERLDSRLRDRRRAEDAFASAVVAEVPSFSRKQRGQRLVVGPDQHNPAAEAYRSLRTSLTFMAAGGQPSATDDHVGVILVTSPSPAEGKTTTSVNLGSAFAETGRSVLIVNSDFRRPMATSAVVEKERPPLPAGLAGIDRLDAAEFLAPTKIPGVDLLDLSPLGGTPGDLTRATLKLVRDLEARVDVVIIDTPPLGVTTEALEFVPVAKVVVLVGRLGHTPTTSAERAGELVRFGGAEQVAITLTDTGSGSTRHGNYYDYYREQDESGSRRRRRSGGKRARQSSEAVAVKSTAVTDSSDAADDAQPETAAQRS
jgi:Mrp family chromosome partitioning ATPase